MSIPVAATVLGLTIGALVLAMTVLRRRSPWDQERHALWGAMPSDLRAWSKRWRSDGVPPPPALLRAWVAWERKLLAVDEAESAHLKAIAFPRARVLLRLRALLEGQRQRLREIEFDVRHGIAEADPADISYVRKRLAEVVADCHAYSVEETVLM